MASMNQFQIIEKYLSVFPQTSSFIKTINDVLGLDQSQFHLTASGFVLQGNSMLLIKHRYLKVWLQPGGHIDLGEHPCDAAQREVLEERVGLQNILVMIFHLILIYIAFQIIQLNLKSHIGTLIVDMY